MPQFFTKKTRLGLQVITPAAVATMYIPTYTCGATLPFGGGEICVIISLRAFSQFMCTARLVVAAGWCQEAPLTLGGALAVT